MKIRTKTPKNNKYYIRRVTGGLNGAVAGSPTIAGANVLCNCVGFANGRFNEICNDPDLKGIVKPFQYQLVCNAENFIESAKQQGLKISPTPIQGGIMVWQKGSTLRGSDGAGHVAVVEEVYEDGTIMTSESGWGAWAFKNVRRNNSNGRWGQANTYKFRGCIINPSVKDPKVVPVPPLKVDGIGGANTVRAMQRFFGTPQDGVISGQKKANAKTYPALKAVEFGKGGSLCIKKLQKWVGTSQDGILGEKTVKAWQHKLKVAEDGVFGANSMRAWQEYLNKHEKAVYPKKKVEAKPTGIAAKIVANVKEFAWKYNTKESKYEYPKGSAKKAYKTALKKYCKKKAKISQTDCGYFVNTTYRAAGVKDFDDLPDKSSQPYPKLPSKVEIVLEGKRIPDGFLKAGDAIVYKKTHGQHTMISLGNGRIAEAQRGHCFPAIKKDTEKYNKANVKKSTIRVIRAK